jgi:1-acyl-sn-glycerol-3-phosphate acyltransferase
MIAPRISDEPAPGPGWWANGWHAIGLLFWTVIFKLLNRVEVRGQEHIPARGERSVFILANHVSAIDPFLIGVTAMPFFSPVWWRAMAKSELFDVPLVGTILRSWGALPVKRGQRDFKALEQVAENLRHDVIVAFPEGTRSTDGQLLPGRPGIGKLIYDARPRKIIPAAIAGTEAILPKDRILPRWGRTAVIAYGRPIDVSRYYPLPDSAETSQHIVDEVMCEIARLRAAIRESDPAQRSDNGGGRGNAESLRG